MKSLIIFTFLGHFLFSCARTQGEIDLSRERARKILFFHMKSRNLKVALKAYVFLNQPKNSLENLLFSQFHLLSCNPRKALHFIKNETGSHAELLRAIVFATTSVERGAEEKVAIKLVKNKVMWSLDSEVWPDEWDQIEAPNGQCQKMPLAKEENRKLLNRVAKSKFRKLKTKDFLNNFDLVMMALDLGHKFQKPEILLTHFSKKQDNLYYQLLQRDLKNRNLALNVKKFNQTGSIELSLFDLTQKKWVPKSLQIPFVLQEKLL